MRTTMQHHTPATQQLRRNAAQMDSLICSHAGHQAAQADTLACSSAGHMRNTGQIAAQADSLACSYTGPPCASSSLPPTTTLAPQMPVADRQQHTTLVRPPPLTGPQHADNKTDEHHDALPSQLILSEHTCSSATTYSSSHIPFSIDNATNSSSPSSTSPTALPKTTRSGRTVHFPARFLT